MRNLFRALPFLTVAGLAISCGNTSSGVSEDGGGSGGASSGTAGAGAGGAHASGGTTGGGGITGGGGSNAGTGGSISGAGGATGNGGATGTGGRATGAGGTTGAGGAATGAGGATTSTGGAGGATASVSVLQYHNTAARDGVYVDARITPTAAGTMHADTTFGNTAILGPVYAQPLYLAGVSGGADQVLVATAQNHVYALNATTGVASWNVTLGNAVTPGVAGLCGSPLNPLGITGTPVIDATSRTIFLDAMTNTTANGARHMIHALAIDSNGTERTGGWPIDVTATATSGGTTFNAPIQNQRAALALLGGKVFVPFGGHIGDCDGYHGWIVGVTTTGTPQVSAWATTAFAGGIWGSSGIASDGTSLYVTTGNTKATAASGATGSTPGDGNWGGGEAVLKFPTSLVQPAPTTTTDYFFPTLWATMDRADQDLGGVGPVLFSVPGATPSNLVMALGKDKNAYLLNRVNLGGMDATPLAGATVATNVIITSAVAYTTPTATYVAFRGAGVGCPGGTTGAFTAIKVSATSPPALSIAWCAGAAAATAPAVSVTSAQGANAVLWYAGTDGHLHGINGDTGASVRADTTTMGAIRPHQAPIVANGRIFVATDARVYAFTP